MINECGLGGYEVLTYNKNLVAGATPLVRCGSFDTEEEARAAIEDIETRWSDEKLDRFVDDVLMSGDPI